MRCDDGEYAHYLPKGEPAGLLVLVHGTPAPNDSDKTLGLARDFAGRWVDFAETHRLIVLAPAFDNTNFGSLAGPGGGYRGLFGRRVDADVFVNGLIDAHKNRIQDWGGRILLYGHSAGGQFVSRYVVRHTDRILAAVIGAAGTFAMPNPNAAWPDGMAPLRRSMQWGPAEPRKRIRIRPDATGWLKAATIPITVVVGSRDTEGRSHVNAARQWVLGMRNLAQQNKKDARVCLVLVDGVGHSSRKLTPACQEALSRSLKEQKAVDLRAAGVAAGASGG